MESSSAMPHRNGKLRPELPPLPRRMRSLKVDHRGYPVPYFVAWVDGKPDHRLVDPVKLSKCLRLNRCWVCGERLGTVKVFGIGPMCVINRISAEPPSHPECMNWSAQACPFLTRPHASRRDAGLPEDVTEPGGTMIKRNPGVVALWSTRHFEVIETGHGQVFRIGLPERIDWKCQGRPATREEIIASIESGIPELQRIAAEDDAHNGDAAASDELREAIETAMRMVPA